MTEDIEDIVSEWEKESFRHPIFGERMPSYVIDDMWESGSATYSDSRYSVIKDGIVDAMIDGGILLPDDTVLDIGSGPGTFAIPMSGHCRSVLCVDKSPGMLRRITEAGIDNISVLNSDCFELSKDYKRDLAFSSLCPPMNNPAGIDLMGRLGRKCVYVSSANKESNLECRVWKELGEDYSYAGYDTDYPYRYLKAKGIDADIRYFSQDWRSEEPCSVVQDRMVATIKRYRQVDDATIELIREVVADESEDGLIRQSLNLRIGMLTWSP